MDWEEVTLGELIDINKKNINKNNDYSYINYYDISSIGTGLKKESKYYRVEDMPSRAKRIIDNHDIIISTVRPIHRAFYYCENTKYNDVVSTGFAVLTARKKFLDSRFLYYIISSDDFTNYLVSHQQGATYPTITPDTIKKSKIKLPPLKTQKKIASILSNYDKLIENNNKRIKLLESMAEEIYKEWFVRLRFPEFEKVEIVDGVPEGWENLALKELAILTMGQSPKSDAYNEEKEGLPFHQGVTNYGFRFPSNQTWSREGKRYAEKGDILFSVRAPVGRLNIASEKIIIGRGISSIRHKKSWNSFLFYALKHIFFEDDLIGSGSIFSSVTKKDMENIIILESDDNLMFEFNKIVEPMDKEIRNLLTKNKNLKETRDLLLPKLIHGTLNVED